jgi:zinc transport system substrate-binding protein
MKINYLYMKKALITLLIAAVVLSGLYWVAQISTSTNSNDNQIKVSASYYPLYDFAKNVGGDKIDVVNLTPAGSEPHDYDPSPKVIADALGSDVFIYNGAHMEPWVDGFLETYGNTVVKSSNNIDLMAHEDEEHGEEVGDPHFWLDPVLAIQIIDNILESLKKADPNNSQYYTDNANSYIDKLRSLDEDFREGLAVCSLRTVVSSHEAFGYLAKRYDLNVIAIAGLSPEEEPSVSKLAEISKIVEEQGIQYIFFESLSSPKLADTIASETGAKTIVFDPIEGLTDEALQQGKDYISVQRDNLANLRTALACQ